jgi:hypothetical protein
MNREHINVSFARYEIVTLAEPCIESSDDGLKCPGRGSFGGVAVNGAASGDHSLFFTLPLLEVNG